MTQVWIVGRYRGEGPDGSRAWELLGVFTAEEHAVTACTAPEHFVGPVPLDERLPEETLDWPGARYPMANGTVP